MYAYGRGKTRLIIIALAVLMAATRFHHFGSPFSLPDASLAVFFMGGLYLGGLAPFGLLLAEACAIDYAAIAYAGVSDYCISPAYVFLIPTYAVLWMAGRQVQRPGFFEKNAALGAVFLLIVSTSLAFVISNGSFYLFSDPFSDLSWFDYTKSVVFEYYPLYMLSTLVYVSIPLGIRIFSQARDIRKLEFR